MLAYSATERTKRVISRAQSFSFCNHRKHSPFRSWHIFSSIPRRSCPLFPITLVSIESELRIRSKYLIFATFPVKLPKFLQQGVIMMRRKDQVSARKIPSLVDLCIEKVIDNIRYLGNVGSVDHHLLEQILPHCSSAEQLMHVEKASEGTDLSPITDKLWKKFFEKQYGLNCTNEIIRRMGEKRVSFKWMQLYEAKAKEMAQAEKEAVERMKQRYKKEDAKKQSRQVQICTKLPPSSKKRFWGDNGSGYNVSNTKSNIMKKAKIDFLKSREVQNLAAMKKNTIQRSSSSSSIVKTGSISRVGSTSKSTQSTRRLF